MELVISLGQLHIVIVFWQKDIDIYEKTNVLALNMGLDIFGILREFFFKV